MASSPPPPKHAQDPDVATLESLTLTMINTFAARDFSSPALQYLVFDYVSTCDICLKILSQKAFLESVHGHFTELPGQTFEAVSAIADVRREVATVWGFGEHGGDAERGEVNERGGVEAFLGEEEEPVEVCWAQGS